jgi:predicted deacylase
MTHPIECTIDLTEPGRRVGRLEIPKSTNTGGWAHQFIPIASIAGDDGPTALVMGGNHGDEYEGQVAGLKLLRELRPEQLNGRVIVIPCLSPEAAKAGTRLWPNGVNFNRSFPGRIDGPANEQLAHFVSTVLMPMSDYVIDMHSGGSTAQVVPCSHMHVVEDAAQRKAMLEGMLAWCSDFHYLYIDVAGSGLLPVEAERQGKVVVTTELGGGGLVSRDVHRLTERGLANVLRHAGILEGEVETRASLGLPDAVILDGRDPRTYVFAPTSGILETLVDAGESVVAGQPVGRIYSLEHPEQEPVTVEAPLDSAVVGIRAISWTEQGDNAFIFGEPIEATALL